jgi:hypothetical protein
MNKRMIWALAGGAALALGVVAAASAADRDFCRAYAHAAVREVNYGLQFDRCRDMMAGQGDRWSTDWRVHYGWCRTVDGDQAASENAARHETLRQCAWHRFDSHDYEDRDYGDHYRDYHDQP